jgi:hypothetical protein
MVREKRVCSGLGRRQLRWLGGLPHLVRKVPCSQYVRRIKPWPILAIINRVPLEASLSFPITSPLQPFSPLPVPLAFPTYMPQVSSSRKDVSAQKAQDKESKRARGQFWTPYRPTSVSSIHRCSLLRRVQTVCLMPVYHDSGPSSDIHRLDSS